MVGRGYKTCQQRRRGTGKPPKGPFRTKKTTAIAKIVKLLSRSVFTTPPKFTTLQTLLGEGKCLQFPGNWCPRKVRRDSKSPCRTKNTTRSEFTTRSVFSTAGSFGQGAGGRGIPTGRAPAPKTAGIPHHLLLGPREYHDPPPTPQICALKTIL